MKQFIVCPVCEEKAVATLEENQYGKWIRIICEDEEDCGYDFTMTDLDTIQPTSPFFKLIYGDDPIALAKINKKEQDRKKDKLSEHRENNLELKVKQGILKPWEVKDVKSYVRDNDL